MDALDNFYTDQSFVDWYTTTKDIPNMFQKGSVFGLDDYQFLEYRFTQISCAKVWEFMNGKKSRNDWTFIFVLIKKCFENSSCKRLSFNNSANSSCAWQVCVLLKFRLCVVCGCNFSWIKVKSASETVYEAFNFSFKLLGVLSKQLA